MKLRDAIHRIALEWPAHGRPRLTAELRGQGWKVNPKRVRRIMREDNLLCLRKRKFVVDHRLQPRTQRLPEPGPKDDADGAGSTGSRYHRTAVAEEFIFPGVILDAHSRRVIGWALIEPWKTI